MVPGTYALLTRLEERLNDENVLHTGSGRSAGDGNCNVINGKDTPGVTYCDKSCRRDCAMKSV